MWNVRKFLYLFTRGLDVNNDFASFFASTDFVDKITDSGIYGNFGQHVTFDLGHLSF